MATLRADTILAAAVVTGGLVYLWADSRLPTMAIGDPLGPKVFPALVGGGLIVSGLLLFLETWKKRHERPAIVIDAADRRRKLLTLGAMAAWTALYYATFEWAGYLIGTPIFIFGLLTNFHRGRHWVNVAASVGFTLIAYALFSLLLGVPLPTGPLPI